MKVKDLNEEILESDTLGELMGWNLINFSIRDFPESKTKIKVLELIGKREKELIEMDV